MNFCLVIFPPLLMTTSPWNVNILNKWWSSLHLFIYQKTSWHHNDDSRHHEMSISDIFFWNQRRDKSESDRHKGENWMESTWVKSLMDSKVSFMIINHQNYSEPFATLSKFSDVERAWGWWRLKRKVREAKTRGVDVMLKSFVMEIISITRFGGKSKMYCQERKCIKSSDRLFQLPLEGWG